MIIETKGRGITDVIGALCFAGGEIRSGLPGTVAQGISPHARFCVFDVAIESAILSKRLTPD
jgi:hypothetical protein